MLYHLVVAIGLILFLMIGWLLVQQLAKKQSPELPEDCDVLEGRFGCAGCALAGKCSRQEQLQKEQFP